MPGDHNSNKQSYSIECIAEYCFHAPFRYSQYFTLYFGSIFSTVSIQKETKQFAKLVPFKLIMLSMHTKCYTYVGMLFIYFGLVFNTATPFKLITKLHEVSCHVIVRSRLSLFQGVLLLEPIPALSQGEGRVFPGQVASSSQGPHWRMKCFPCNWILDFRTKTPQTQVLWRFYYSLGLQQGACYPYELPQIIVWWYF